MENLHGINKNLETEVEQLQPRVSGLTLKRNTEWAKGISLGTKFEEAEKKLKAANDCISNMYMDLQGSIMTELYRWDLEGGYNWILDMIPGVVDPANEEFYKGG